MSFGNPILGGAGTLIRARIKSPNYVAGVSGWAINKDGSAEFNNGVFRGTLVIGSTTVTTIGTTGISVVGPEQTMVVDNSSGFKVTRTTTDGRSAQLDISNTTGNSSTARLSLGAVSPTAAGNTITNKSLLSATITGAAGAECTLLQIGSGFFTGKGQSLIQLEGQTGGSAVDDTTIFIQAASILPIGAVSITGALSATGNGDIDGTLRLGPLNQEIGQGVVSGAHAQASSTGTVAEAIISTATSVTYQAGHAYRITVYGLVNNATAAGKTILRVHKTNVAGQQLLEAGTVCTVIGQNYEGGATGVFVVTGSNVTASLVLTCTSGAAGNAVHVGGATFPRGIYIEDIGSSANPALSGIPALV